MFMSVQDTGFEIRFRIFGIPVMVHPFFWLMALIMLGNGVVTVPDGHPVLNLVGMLVIVFVSILVHELGHSALMAWYRIRSEIVLYAMGGYAMPVGGRGIMRGLWDQVWISLAGPVAQFLLLGLVIVGVWYLPPLPPNRFISYQAMVFVAVYCNLVWPILNLLPILPLDGGRICQAFCRMFQGHYQGDITALWISIILGSVLVAMSFQYQQFTSGIFLIYLTIQNFQELQQRVGRW
ncbi:MAG: site-2 protease family protein [Planctomycetaceae bacterium]|nr:site-2 protease family protein [Planctomycetaceae bacterium]